MQASEERKGQYNVGKLSRIDFYYTRCFVLPFPIGVRQVIKVNAGSPDFIYDEVGGIELVFLQKENVCLRLSRLFSST